MTPGRGRLLAYLLCLVAAGLVWHGVFGLLVSRGEKQYLLDQARAELGRRPPVSMSRVMDDTIRDGVRQASRWAAAVFSLTAAGVWLAQRSKREDDEEPETTP